jgi:TetR/AcrR family transcriptional regulator, transcriptional repressor for nem operon
MARPKNFDEQEVLTKAVDLFWCKGYNATSIQDVVENLCINRASLYDTYGDKHTLFIKALKHYQALQATALIATIEQATAVKDTIKGIFDRAVKAILQDSARRGCFMANATLELAGSDPEVNQIVSINRQNMENAFYQAIVKGQQSGEITSAHDPEALASFLFSTYNGLQVIGKTHAGRKTLEDIVKVSLSVLD